MTNMAQVIISNTRHLEITKQAISNAGADKFHVVADFDRTLTKAFANNAPTPSLISVLRTEKMLTPDYADKAQILFDKYRTNDLYKCFILQLIKNNCKGGILIIPLNFFCSTRVSDIKIRQDFLKKYSIIRINIFEEQVFDDTSYTICSFQFSKNSNGSKNSNNTICTIYPENKKIDFNLTPENNYTIGGEIYKLPQNNKWTVSRAVNGKSNTNILIKCIDDSVKIRLSIVDDDTTIKYIDNTVNHTAR